MGHSDSKIDPQMTAEGAQNGIPPVIRFSYQKSWKKLVCFSRMAFSLGAPDSEPTHSISFPRGLYGDIVLHNGPDIESMPLAVATKDGSCRTDYVVALPRLPGSGSESGSEILRHPTGRKGKWWFAMTVGQGPDAHVERFEWRRSRGEEVKSIGQSKWGGYKLVRLGSDKADQYSSDEDGADEKRGFSSDGKEIVAVWATASTFKSFTGVGELHFRGSGATGELGTLWSLMVVMTWTSIWQKTQRDAATAGSTSSAGASVAVTS